MTPLDHIKVKKMRDAIKDKDLTKLASVLFTTCPSILQKIIDELFCYAISTEKMDSVEFLWMSGADVNKPATDYFGFCPLSLATRTGNNEIVKFLLRNKDIDINQYLYGITAGDPLWGFFRHVNMDPKVQFEILSEFLKRGAILDRDYWTNVHSSLLSTLHTFSPRDEESYNLLYYATHLLKEAEAGEISKETVKKLGPALNGKRKKDKKNALQIAIEKEDTNGIQILQDAYAEFEIELDEESIKPPKKKA